MRLMWIFLLSSMAFAQAAPPPQAAQPQNSQVGAQRPPSNQGEEEEKGYFVFHNNFGFLNGGHSSSNARFLKGKGKEFLRSGPRGMIKDDGKNSVSLPRRQGGCGSRPYQSKAERAKAATR